MDAELQTLIRQCQGEQHKGIQFIQIITGNAPVWIRSNAITNFILNYCQLVDCRSGNYGLAEAIPPNTPIPLVVQGVFRYTSTSKITDLDQDILIYYIIAAFQAVIRTTLQISNSALELIAVRLNRSVMEDDKPHFYYRIQFPYCRIDQDLYGMIRNQVLTLLQDVNPFNAMSSIPAGGWDSYIDPTPLRFLTLYGSANRPGLEPLEFDEIYAEIDFADFTNVNGDNYQEPMIQPRDNLIEPTQYAFIKHLASNIEGPDINFKFWLPVFLSIYYGSSRTVLKAEGLPISLDPTPMNTPAKTIAQTDLDIAKQLLPVLDKGRGENTFYFKHIGRALFTITAGNDDGYNLWVDFGRKTGANVRQCNDWWHTFEGNWRDIKTIIDYARHDNLEFYKQWAQEWRSSALNLAISTCKHAHVAKALHKVFMLDYVCSSVNLNSWYKYEKHRWHHIDKAYSFSIAITEEFGRYIDEHQHYLTSKKVATNDIVERDKINKDLNNVNTLLNKLADGPFKDKVIKEACNYFHDPFFNDRFDNAPDVICVQTGVIEMNDEQYFFRPGSPQDYITLSTGVAYDYRLNIDSTNVRRTLTWINQLMAEPSLVHCMHNYLGSMLYGGNLDKKLVVWTGPPDAGKSSITRAITIALGKYGVKGDNNVLYSSSRGEAPSPSMARLRGVRGQWFEELETEKGVISSGFVKRITGNDSFYARALFSQGGEIDPLFKSIFVCNLVPQFSTFDKATRERVLILPFGSRWVDDAPIDPDAQMNIRTFKRDRYFNKNMQEIAKSLLWLMVYWYPQYAREGLPQPAEVKTMNKKYWDSSDYYHQFVESHIIPYKLANNEPDNKFWVDLTQSFNEFKIWFKQNYPTYKVPNISIYRDGMCNNIGPISNNKWFGFAMASANQQ